jgi:Spy/CpxP family protein refolding chaperone
VQPSAPGILNAPHTMRCANLATVIYIDTQCRIFAAVSRKTKIMQPRSAIAVLALCALAIPALAADMPATPYAGQQARRIKALSDEDITALRKGEGMGMAKAAELNGYPGPAHVLALARELSLTDEQLRQVRLAFDRMNAAARPLGEEVIAHERTLDRLFAEGRASGESATTETASIGELQGRLRSVHLAAHLEMRAFLTPDQIATYVRLRGYGDGAEPPHQHHHSG